MSTGPDTWGPHGWKFIHFIALGYPNNPNEKDKEKYKHFFYILSDMIPCVICAEHYKKNLNQINIDLYLDSKTNLIHWTILMHNEVNKSNGKKVYTFNEGLKMIIDGQGPSKCIEPFSNCNKSQTSYNNALTGFLILIIILLLIYIYKES
jgi:hypothetical protein